jgi:hypothetical protein
MVTSSPVIDLVLVDKKKQKDSPLIFGLFKPFCRHISILKYKTPCSNLQPEKVMRRMLALVF